MESGAQLRNFCLLFKQEAQPCPYLLVSSVEGSPRSTSLKNEFVHLLGA